MALQVYCRIRDGSYNKIIENESKCKITIKHKKTKHEFIINKLWKPDVNNEQIFDDLFSNTNDYTLNYWVAFGYTGSGKTYTTSNLIKNLYNTLDIDKKCRLQISAIQIYNDHIYDLLNENNPLIFYKTNDLVVKNMVKKCNENIDDMINMIVNNRNTAKTEMNNTSSRSHAIITIYFNRKKYVIVDMAGQETVSSTNKDELIQKQANNINLNMLALKECIRNINDKKKYIPYRRTLITLALKPIFEGKSNVAFICNVNLKQQLYYQIDSLRYASSLYRKNGKDNNNLIKIFELYTQYVQDSTWYNSQERMLWHDNKESKNINIKSIENLLKKKKKCIDSISKHINSYKVLPPIKTDNKNII